MINLLKKSSVFLLFFLVACLILWNIFRPDSKEKSNQKKTPLVTICKVEKKDIAKTIELTGEVVVTNRVIIKTTVTGIIAYCPWREGDHIKSGELLIKIDRPLLIAEMDAIKAKLDDLNAGTRPEEILRAQHDITRLKECEAYAKSDLVRNLKLNKKGAVSTEAVEMAKVAYSKCSNDLQSAMEKMKILQEGATKTERAILKAQVQEAVAQYNISKEKVRECEIKSPFAGIVTKVFVRKGDLVREGREDVVIMEIIDPSSIVVRFHVPEQYASLMKKNGDVFIAVDSLSRNFLPAKIVMVYPEIDDATHTLTLEASLNTPNISPGMFARVKLPVYSAKNALVIPESALLTAPTGKNYVFIISDGKAVRRSVEKGLESGLLVQIKKGLSSGDSVIVAGNAKLKDGVPVKVKKDRLKSPEARD
jgi:membrane fusion protein (multidrug efflux system)